MHIPSAVDLLSVWVQAVDVHAEAAAGAMLLFQRCVLEVRYQGAERAAETLPRAVPAAIADRMRELDPQADIRLSMACPTCRHAWLAAFDIGSFFWSEL